MLLSLLDHLVPPATLRQTAKSLDPYIITVDMTMLAGGCTLAMVLTAGVLAQSASRQFRWPGIVPLLSVGSFFSLAGLGWIAPSSLGNGLFAGGLNL